MAICGLLAACSIVIIATDQVAAQIDACLDIRVCQGAAMVFIDNGLGNTRTMSICTADQVCRDEGFTWELDAGSSITFFYRFQTAGAAPPMAPNKVTIEVRNDNGATVIRQFLNAGAEPANGASFTFFSTSDGTGAGAQRAGTYRLFLVVVKDNAPGGVGNYNFNSDGLNNPSDWHKGALRGKTKVSDLSRNAFPSGSMFALGPAGNEVMTVSSTATDRIADTNVETLQVGFVRTTTEFNGGTVEIGAGGTNSHSRNCDADVFGNGTSTLKLRWTLIGNAALTNLRWTITATTGHGSGLTRVDDDTIENQSTFNCDPSITVNSTTCTQSIYNRLEAASCNLVIHNARAQAMTRSATVEVRNSAPATENSQTLTGSPYVSAYTPSATHTATHDATGSPKTLRWRLGTSNIVSSGTAFSLSNLYRFGPNTGSCTTPNDTATFTPSVVNRGNSFTYAYCLFGVRGQSITSTAMRTDVKDSTPATESTFTDTTSGTGAVSRTYTIPTTAKATADLTGDPHKLFAQTSGQTGTNGNFADTVNTFGVSSLWRFTTDTCPTVTNTATFNFDVYNRGESPSISYRICNADGTAFSGTVTSIVRSNIGTTEDSQSVTHSGGLYSYSYAIISTDAALHNTVGDRHTLRATGNGNQADATNTFGVSDLYFLDVHVQKTTTLVKDDFPSPDATEEHTLVIGADLMEIWIHVDGVRTDNDIDTNTGAVACELRDPGSNIQDSFTDDTASDGWTGRHEFVPIPPAGVWLQECDVSFGGNTGTDTEAINFVSAFTENLQIRLWANNTVTVGTTITIALRTEESESATQPETLPRIKIQYFVFGTPATWETYVDWNDTRNGQDHTFTVNQDVYYLNVTFNQTGTFNIIALATINGAGIHQQHNIDVTSLGVDEMGLDFDGIDSAGMIELGIWTALLLFALYQRWPMTVGVSIVALALKLSFNPNWGFRVLAIFALLTIVLEILPSVFKRRREFGVKQSTERE